MRIEQREGTSLMRESLQRSRTHTAHELTPLTNSPAAVEASFTHTPWPRPEFHHERLLGAQNASSGVSRWAESRHI